jgi:cysteinyl-tRNA synthetase
MKTVKLYNTLTRKQENFRPINAGKVGIYTCGPTVYSFAHIGNMRAYIFADTLRRMFEKAGFKVNHVMNITDVGHLTSDADDGDDKMEVAKEREGLTAWKIAEKYTEAFFAHSKALNILMPNTVCKATDHIQKQIDMVKTLEEKGYTYTTSDGVYFDTEEFPEYGEMAKLDIEGLQKGKRVDLGEKRNKTDFALWKFSPKDEQRDMEWDSPWGKGFPGWHIECSAMSREYLGKHFDIHTGGIDHIPVHHTNEIAQSECSSGESPVVNYWLHSNFLNMGDAGKMSKSKGDVFTVDVLKEQGIAPLSYRYLCLTAHYRSEIQYSDEAIKAADKALRRLAHHVERLEDTAPSNELSDIAKAYETDFNKFLATDLNTSAGLAVMWKMLAARDISNAEKLALLVSFDDILAFDMLNLPAYFANMSSADISDEFKQKVETLIEKREKARAEKDYAASDAIRDELVAMKVVIEDSSSGTTWRLK